MSTTSVDSLAALLWLLAAASVVIVYLWTALALASMFRKMGEESWRAWVPVLPHHWPQPYRPCLLRRLQLLLPLLLLPRRQAHQPCPSLRVWCRTPCRRT